MAKNTIYVSLDAGLTEHNFQTVQKIYQEVVDQKKIGKVPVLIAEDETASTAQVAYSEDKDVLVGFCGPKATDTEQHICRDSYNIPVGDGEEGYTNITSAFQDNKIGSLARAVIINPLHPDLPKIPILIHPTCNKFNAAFVKHQWKEIDRLFKLYLEDTVGPLVGQSSDGDTRRRNLMMETATSNSEKYQPIPHEEGFIYTCNKHEKADGTYSISDLFDQDYVHNHKKLVNHLFHSSKQLTIGRYHVNSNHLTLLHQLFRFDEHGLQAEDLTRSDRQNWQSAQRICFLKVQDCLRQVLDGSVEGRLPDGTVKGTLIFLKIIWAYVEIFCSGCASLRDRIKYAALVSHFLDLWRKYITVTDGLTQKSNFLSRESCTDVQLSCHCAVSRGVDFGYICARVPVLNFRAGPRYPRLANYTKNKSKK